MRYQNVCVEAFSCLLPPHQVTSEELERRLEPVYSRLGVHVGRIELMSGIRERRFYDPGTRPGSISSRTAEQVLQLTGFDRSKVGALIHGSVCRDQMEPATAASVHHALQLPDSSLVIDVSNACLGLLNGALLIADQIEAGLIRAGIVVGTEEGRGLVEGTIDRLNALAASGADRATLKNALKADFASLTIGSGSAAILLCDRKLSRSGHRLLGGAMLADTAAHELCAGGVDAAKATDGRPQMSTDSEALLHAGVNLAERTWPRLLQKLDWQAEDVQKVFTHQVGKAHRKLLLERLGIAESLDFPTVEYLGNTGATALPTAVALGTAARHVQPGENVALLGIGSGLSCVMLGLQWGGGPG